VQVEKLLPKREGAAGRLVAQLTLMVRPATESPVLDVLVMAAIRALGVPGEPDVYAEVARLFLADVPIHLSALGAAIAAERVESVCQIAHRLRGSSLEMGALRMAPVCAAIEHGARAGSLEHAAARADRLHHEFATARRELEQVIQ
jgi:HPt (histidine-containing phosphotransfer) domain-containing protein